MAAAKEFNIGKDTLVDFLEGKGFSRDDLKPTSKLTEAMYRALQAEFQGDKVAKAKSELVDLPKGAAQEARRKRDEEEIIFRKEEKKVLKKGRARTSCARTTASAPAGACPATRSGTPARAGTASGRAARGSKNGCSGN